MPGPTVLIKFNHTTTQPRYTLTPYKNPSRVSIIPARPNQKDHILFTPRRRRTAMMESDLSRRSRGSHPPLCKQNSWSPDTLRDEAWTNRRKSNRLRRGRSVTEDDLDELRGCFELGFNFDSPDLDPKLSSIFPALEFYHAVNRLYSNSLSRSSSASFADSDTASFGSPASIVDPGDDPATVKTRLRQWAQVVARSVRQSPSYFL